MFLILCRLIHTITIEDIHLSISFAFISNRYYAVTGGKHGSSQLSRHKNKLVLTTWVVALLVNVLPILGWSPYHLDRKVGVCGIDWSRRDTSGQTYTIFLVLMMLVAPIAVQTVAYVKLYTEVAAASKKVRSCKSFLIKSTIRALTVGAIRNEEIFSKKVNMFTSEKSADLRNQKRLARVIVSMEAMLISTWLPYATVLITLNFTDIPLEILKIAALLPALNVLSDPIIYVLHNRNLRKSFRAYFNPVVFSVQRLIQRSATEFQRNRNQQLQSQIVEYCYENASLSSPPVVMGHGTRRINRRPNLSTPRETSRQKSVNTTRGIIGKPTVRWKMLPYSEGEESQESFGKNREKREEDELNGKQQPGVCNLPGNNYQLKSLGGASPVDNHLPIIEN